MSEVRSIQFIIYKTVLQLMQSR